MSILSSKPDRKFNVDSMGSFWWMNYQQEIMAAIFLTSQYSWIFFYGDSWKQKSTEIIHTLQIRFWNVTFKKAEGELQYIAEFVTSVWNGGHHSQHLLQYQVSKVALQKTFLNMDRTSTIYFLVPFTITAIVTTHLQTTW